MADILLAAQPRNQRAHQLIERDGRGNRVARQPAEPAVGEAAKGERFARLDGEFPEADFAKLLQQRFGVVRFADGNAAGAQHQIGLAIGLLERGAQGVRVVADNAEVNHIAAERFKHQVHRETVGVIYLAFRQRLAGELEFIAGGENRDARLAHYLDFGNAERGEQRQFGGAQFLACLHHHRALTNIFAATADVLPRAHRR